MEEIPTATSSTHEIVPVNLDMCTYDIHIGSGVMDQAGSLIAALLHRKHTIVVTDKNVAKHHLSRLVSSLGKEKIISETVILEPGEQIKSFSHLEFLSNELLNKGIDRNAFIVALGGGVVGDLVGFTAAIALRGIDFIQVPTSLLSQVDSSVGGKTGINSIHGKNLIGAFHQPRLVIADTRTLQTLPERELKAGYAEVIKYGLISNSEFFSWLEVNGARILRGDAKAQQHAITVSCRIKASVVSDDERERGQRALLNLGHTFGHALETETGFSSRLLHGEGVFIGLVMALQLSERLSLCPTGTAERLRQHLHALDIPHDLKGLADPSWSAERLVEHMEHDKKAVDSKLTFILVQAIGKGVIANDVEKSEVLDVLQAALDRA